MPFLPLSWAVIFCISLSIIEKQSNLQGSNESRSLAKGTLNFVYSLSKNWKPEYGGNLYLLEDDYKTIKKVILSSYNRLALTYMNSPDRKELGTPHFVSQLSNGCVKPRISITGWVS